MRTLIALLLLLITAPVPAADADDTHIIARGRDLSKLFLDRKAEALWAQMTPRMQQALGNRAALEAFRDQVASQLGDEVEVLEEKTTHAEGVAVYLRTARWSKLSAHVVMQWAIDDGDHVAGFFVKPEAPASAAPSTHLDYQTKSRLRLPFDGEWFVVWGGRTLEQNYHAIDRGQRFAYDLLMLRDGKTHRGNGADVAEYYCWNTPILAPANGTIVEAVDGLPDQKPGSRDPAHPAGNHVMIDLGNGEYALLAHFRSGSLKVKGGDAATAGREIGRCGNSGNTTEPHLHFHLQDTPRFGDGDGLPAFFNDYIADGKPVTRGEPVKGQTIRSR